MKTILLLAAFLISFAVHSQDTVKLRQIDSLVKEINRSNLEVQRDTLVQDRPELGLSMRTYLSMVRNGAELKKYVNKVHMNRQENGVAKQMVTTNTFYFDHNRLIKVEESAGQDDLLFEMLWYYADDKPLYYTLKSDKAAGRAEFLLTLAKGMLEKMGFK